MAETNSHVVEQRGKTKEYESRDPETISDTPSMLYFPWVWNFYVSITSQKVCKLETMYQSWASRKTCQTTLGIDSIYFEDLKSKESSHKCLKKLV